jgi:3-hydroxyisobutyrate dehydrogenase-like beta-hydroxyacid dehydrogenase
MGAAVGVELRANGHSVLWASAGRSEATAARAAQAALEDVGTVEALAAQSEVILSVCPPHAALDVARRDLPRRERRIAGDGEVGRRNRPPVR